MTNKTVPTDERKAFDAWAFEIENYAMRIERLSSLSRIDALWAAWQAAKPVIAPLSFESADWVDNNPNASAEEKTRMMMGDILQQQDTLLNQELSALRKAIDDQQPWAKQKMAFLRVTTQLLLDELPPVIAPDMKLYQELIYAVSMKWPNETRHETALKYIKQAESTDLNANASKIVLAAAPTTKEPQK